MRITIRAEIEDDEGTHTILKGRIDRHREDVAGDSEASFIGEWQLDRGDGDAVLVVTTVDDFDWSSLNAIALIAEAVNEVDIGHQVRKGDYAHPPEPTWGELIGRRKRRNRLE